MVMSAARRIKMLGNGNLGYQGKDESCKTGLELGIE
jgi:hypothetical protein